MRAIFNFKLVTTSLTSILPKPLLLSTTATSTSTSSPPLTQSELTQVHHLIPHLIHHNHLPTAINLLITILLHTTTPLSSLPLPTLITHLSSLPFSHSTSLLSAIAPNPTLSIPISTLLLTAYFKHRRPREALAVYKWLWARGPVDGEVGRVVVVGMCRCGEVKEALRVLGEVVRRGSVVVVGREVRRWVYWGLLREARVREAMEVEKALGGIVEGVDGAEAAVVELLDRLISEWKE